MKGGDWRRRERKEQGRGGERDGARKERREKGRGKLVRESVCVLRQTVRNERKKMGWRGRTKRINAEPREKKKIKVKTKEKCRNEEKWKLEIVKVRFVSQ